MRRFAVLPCPRATLDLRVYTASIHTVNSRGQHPTVHACAVVCTCSAEVLPTCDASPETYVYAPWQLETLEQKTTQVTTEEQKPQVSPLNHAPESNHLDTNPTSWPCESNPIPTPDLRLRVDNWLTTGLNPNPTRAHTPNLSTAHATTPHISAKLASQSALLEQAAIKSRAASHVESCGAKSTVLPERSSVKATTLLALAYNVSTQLSAKGRHMQRSAHPVLPHCMCLRWARKLQCNYCPHMRAERLLEPHPPPAPTLPRSLSRLTSSPSQPRASPL